MKGLARTITRKLLGKHAFVLEQTRTNLTQKGLLVVFQSHSRNIRYFVREQLCSHEERFLGYSDVMDLVPQSI